MNTPDLSRLFTASGLLGSLFVVFIIGRAVIFFYYEDVVVWPDSEDYASIANYPTWSDELWLAHRPPVYPYIIKSFTDRRPPEGEQPPLFRGLLGYTSKVAIGSGLQGDPEFIDSLASVNVTALSVSQWIVSVFAWSVFALVISKSLPGPWLRVAGVALILSIGLDQNVTLWDRHILTESFSISLFLLLTAVSLAYLRTTRQELIILACIVALLYGGIKGTNPYILLAFAVLMFVTRVLPGIRWTRGFALCGTVFLLIAVLNIYSADKGYRGVVPLQNVLNSRIIAAGYEDVYEYFQAAGMPDVPDSFYEKNWYAPFDAAPALHEWLITEGPGTYKRYLVTHPLYLIGRPFTTPLTEYNLPVYTYYDLYLASYGLSKALGTTFFFGKHSFAAFLLCGVAALIAAGRRLKLTREFEPVFFAYLFLTAVLLSLLVWHGDVIENSRHMLQVAIQLRLAITLIVLYCVGGLLAPKSAARVSPARRL